MALVANRGQNNLQTALFLEMLQSTREETLKTCLCVCVCVPVLFFGNKVFGSVCTVLVIVVQAVGSYTE